MALGFGGDVVGGVGLFVVVSDDDAHELGGPSAGAAAQNVQAVGLLCSCSVSPARRSYRYALLVSRARVIATYRGLLGM
jgi:hypothetical protein